VKDIANHGIQELLRYANLKVTMDTYVEAVSDEKTQSAEQGRKDWTLGENGTLCK
jgi:hypothetical protein